MTKRPLTKSNATEYLGPQLAEEFKLAYMSSAQLRHKMQLITARLTRLTTTLHKELSRLRLIQRTLARTESCQALHTSSYPVLFSSATSRKQRARSSKSGPATKPASTPKTS
jgi:hypothetical protein